MPELKLVLGLLGVVVALAALARRLEVPYPILLVLGGLVIGLVPGLPHVELAPELVFVLFVPPLLLSGGSFTSVRDFKANARPIGLLAVGLVLATAVVVAVVTHAVIPSLGWGAAFALGAIVSPTDELVATAIAQRLGAPRRLVTVLDGESLVNDATALFAYRVAVHDDPSAEREELAARTAAAEAALARIDGLASEWPTHRELLDQLRDRYEHRSHHIAPRLDGSDDAADRELLEHQAIRREVSADERDAVIELRDRGRINDEVLRRIERELDLEALRMEA